MTKILGLVASLLVGRIMGGGVQQPSVLLKFPMLMIRKIIRLFMLGFGSLLIGVTAVGFLLRDITSQLQTQGALYFTASLWISGLLAAAAFFSCAFFLRRKIWTNTEDLSLEVPVPAETARQMDPTHAISTLLFDFLENRKVRRMNQEQPVDYNMNKEMHYDLHQTH
jgi:hypothetical protein